MFGNPTPRHFVSFSASDQSTIRELVNSYDGILVPGTVASYQREGTAGFVLTLSATGTRPPYVIDPRFPLYQQGLPSIKLSHGTLANILGDDNLARATPPDPDDFDLPRIDTIAMSWVDFNLRYRSHQSAKFQKYARRLGTELSLTDAAGPQRILAPYFVADGTDDLWWQRSIEFYDATVRAAAGRIEVTRVIAATSAVALLDLVSDPHIRDCCLWVSGLNELTSSGDELVSYGRAIQTMSQAGHRSFALYGGFFAVMLSAVGLGGSSHGIGYGEYRNWRELPQSGPPPARYYLPTVHRYAQQPDAYELWLHDPKLIAENTVISPISLQYHDLMLHSVQTRSEEISAYRSLSLENTIRRLEEQYQDFMDRLHANGSSRLVRTTGDRLSAHLPRWIDALRNLNH